MTGYGLVVSLGWCSLAGYAAWRADLLVARALAIRNLQELNVATATAERIAADERIAQVKTDAKVRIAELRADAETKDRARRRPTNAIGLPDDLEAYVNSWNDEWARDDERAGVRAKYLELHTGNDTDTWQKVRRAVGIGELP